MLISVFYRFTHIFIHLQQIFFFLCFEMLEKTSPLIDIFHQGYSEERKLSESLKEAKWNHHFSEYGRLVTKLILNPIICLN